MNSNVECEFCNHDYGYNEPVHEQGTCADNLKDDLKALQTEIDGLKEDIKYLKKFAPTDGMEYSDQTRKKLFKGSALDYVFMRANKHQLEYGTTQDRAQANHLRRLVEDETREKETLKSRNAALEDVVEAGRNLHEAIAHNIINYGEADIQTLHIVLGKALAKLDEGRAERTASNVRAGTLDSSASPQPSEMKTSNEIVDRINKLKNTRECGDEETVDAYNIIINALNWVLGKGPTHGGDYIIPSQPCKKCGAIGGGGKVYQEPCMALDSTPVIDCPECGGKEQ